jgi:hypothetical protein
VVDILAGVGVNKTQARVLAYAATPDRSAALSKCFGWQPDQVLAATASMPVVFLKQADITGACKLANDFGPKEVVSTLSALYGGVPNSRDAAQFWSVVNNSAPPQAGLNSSAARQAWCAVLTGRPRTLLCKTQ